jgi:hypothetical protein
MVAGANSDHSFVDGIAHVAFDKRGSPIHLQSVLIKALVRDPRLRSVP